jgi:hypothetical protein
MKTMFLTLAAVLGLALGTASLIPAANAATMQVFHAPNGGNR